MSGLDYTFSDADIRTRVKETDGGITTWGYDKAYQLTSQNRTSPLAGSSYQSTITYDGAGNPTQEQTPTAVTTSTYDAANRLLKQKTGAAITTFAYDAYGSRTKKNASGSYTTYTWDDDHRLKQVTLPSGGVRTFSYNADGLRFSRQTSSTAKTKYVWNGLLLVAETDQNNSPQVGYTQGPSGFGDLISRYRIGAAATDFPLYDALGSLDRITSAAQAQSGRSAYDAYGKVLVNGDSTLQFVAMPGYYYDSDLGLYYIRQRWYDPTIKQWVVPDPGGFAFGFNLYAYCRNDPPIVTDLMGLAGRCHGKKPNCDCYGYDFIGPLMPTDRRGPTPPVPQPREQWCITIEHATIDGKAKAKKFTWKTNAHLPLGGGVGKDACKYYDQLYACGDDYGADAAKACRGQVIQMFGTNVNWIKDGPWSRCIRECLLAWENACARNDQPCGLNPCRNGAHIACYSSCTAAALFAKAVGQNVSDLPVPLPKGMQDLGMVALYEMVRQVALDGGDFKICVGPRR